MQVLHRTVVAPGEIDHLGHMNVHFYGVHARTGAERLLADLGLSPAPGRSMAQRDTYVRHHREQREGAALEVRGGVLDAGPSRLRLYEELVNADTGELAATFVLAFTLVDDATRTAVPLPAEVAIAAERARVDLPEHGTWRSVSFDADPVASAPTLDLLVARDLAFREIRTIDAGECDEHGFVRAGAVAELVWGGVPKPGRAFKPLHELADGAQMGFATLETRATWARDLRAGDRVQSFGAEVERGPKTMLTRNWVVDVDTAELVAVFSVVNVAFNTTTRRAMVVPDGLRRSWDARFHPDLA